MFLLYNLLVGALELLNLESYVVVDSIMSEVNKT